MGLAQCLYLYRKYESWFGVESDYLTTINWLTEMIAWQPDTVCFTYPLFLFDGMEYWQLIYRDIAPGQYIVHKETESVIVCQTWKKYLIFYNGQIEEYAVERDVDTNQYYLIDGLIDDSGEWEFIDLDPNEKISDFLREIVINRIKQITFQQRIKRGTS